MSGEIWGGKRSYTTTNYNYCTAAMWAGCCGSAGEAMVIGLGILGNVEAEFECGGRWTFVHPLFSVLYVLTSSSDIDEVVYTVSVASLQATLCGRTALSRNEAFCDSRGWQKSAASPA
jgi:hypothetical protein